MRIATIALMALAALLLTSCLGGLGGGIIDSTLFTANFRDSSSFPQLDPIDNVLIIDMDSNLEDEVPVQLRIDDALVQTLSLGSGRHEIPFPPAAWNETDGEHTLEVVSGPIVRTLPFSWSE